MNFFLESKQQSNKELFDSIPQYPPTSPPSNKTPADRSAGQTQNVGPKPFRLAWSAPPGIPGRRVGGRWASYPGGKCEMRALVPDRDGRCNAFYGSKYVGHRIKKIDVTS